MMVDRGAQIFQVAAGPARAAACLDVLCAGMRIHFDQHHATEEIIQAADAISKFGDIDLPRLTLDINALAMGMIDCKHVGDIDVLNIAGAA